MTTPTTTFEDTGVKTPIADEQAYVAALLTEYPNITKHTLGQSVQGRELYALRIGSPAADGPALLTDHAIHGAEWANREGALIFAREVAASTDPQVIDFLTRHPLWVVPTFNPDGIHASVRNNANNVNLNREAMRVSQPEGVAVVELIRQVRPMGYINNHDNLGFTDFQVIGAATYETSSTIHAITERLIGNVIHPAVREMDIWVDGATWYYLGNGNVSYFSQYGGAVGALSCTIETGQGLAPAPQAPTAVPGLVTALWAWLQWFVDNEAHAVDVYESQRWRTTYKVAAGNHLWTWQGSRPIPGVNPEKEHRSRVMVGYTLTAGEYAEALHYLNVQDIIVDPQPDGSVYVPLGQPRGRLVVAMLDQSSDSKLSGVVATAVTQPPERYRKTTDLWPLAVGG